MTSNVLSEEFLKHEAAISSWSRPRSMSDNSAFAAPVVRDTSGHPVVFSSLWRERKIVLAFMRHVVHRCLFFFS